MAGTMNSWNTTANKFTNSNGVYTLSLELEAGDHSFKVVKNSGGLSVCVYKKGDNNSKKIAQKCFIEGRVNVYEEADYSEDSELYNLIKEYIKKVAQKN